jgi:hypothetical protein
VIRWKDTVQDLMDDDTGYEYGSDGEEKEKEEKNIDLVGMAVQVSKSATTLLDRYIQYWQFNHIVNLDTGDCLSDMELQSLMQMSCEIVSNIMQTDSVYIGELVSRPPPRRKMV